jgi:hypothetical protein
MKWIPFFLFGLVIGAMVIGAGCTRTDGAGAAPSVATPASPQSPLAGFALTAADVPQNFTLVESRAKTSEEVSSLAKNLGWSGGYVVRFSGMADHPQGATEIVQTITTYPSANLSEIVTVAEANDRADRDLVFTDLPDPGLGKDSRAFSGRPLAQVVLHENTRDPLSSGSFQGTLKQGMVEIIFTKGPAFEVLRMTGPGADYATLLPLARKSSARLP